MGLLNTLLTANPWLLALGFLTIPHILIWLRHRVSDYRIRKAGGVRAPVKVQNLFTGTRYLYNIATSHFQGTLQQWCGEALDNFPGGKKNCFEMSLTGFKRVLLTRDPEQIKAIYATKFASFGHGPQWHRLWKPFLGDGIFATDGQQWHDSRAMVRPMFVKDRVRDLAIFDVNIDKFLSKLPPAGQTIDIKDLFYRLTLDTTTEFLLGKNVNSLDDGQNEFTKAIDTAQRIQMTIFVLNPIAAFIPKKKYFQAIKQMESWIEPIIERAVSLSDAEIDKLSTADEDFSFLHSIARRTKDPRVIRDQIMSVLLAGRDTTAATLSWALYELCAHPTGWAKMRREVLAVLGATGRPTYETLKDLRYVRHVISEVLRLHPAVPTNMRQALETTTIPGDGPGAPDITLLKGDTVTILALGMQTREDLYPPPSDDFAHPSAFSPERWERWTPTPWTYTPFHGGPRICVGQNFAMTEMAFCLVRLVQKYERIEYRGDWHAQTLRADIIGTPALPVQVAFFEKS